MTTTTTTLHNIFLFLDLSSVLQPESANQSTTPTKTFYSLKDKLLHLLFSAISCETDSNNVQLLLHALMVFVSDIGQWWIQVLSR